MATIVQEAVGALARTVGLVGATKSSVICRGLADGLAGNATVRTRLVELVRMHSAAPPSLWVKPALFVARQLREAKALADVAWTIDLLPGMLLDQADLFCEFVAVLFEQESEDGALPRWPCVEVLAAVMHCVASVAMMQREQPVQLTRESLRNLRRQVLARPAIDPGAVFDLLALFVASQEPALFVTVRDMLRGCLKLPLTERKSAFLTAARAGVVRASAAFGDLSRWCLNFYETMDAHVQLHDAWLLLTVLQACPLDEARRQRVHARLRAAAEAGVEEWCAHPGMLALATPLADFLLGALPTPGSSWWCMPALVELASKRADVQSLVVTALLSRLAAPELAPKCLQLVAMLPQNKCVQLIGNFFAVTCPRLSNAKVIVAFLDAVAPLLRLSPDFSLHFFKNMQRRMSPCMPELARQVAACGLAIMTCSSAISSFPAAAIESLLGRQSPAVKRVFYLQLSKLASMILAYGDTEEDATVAFVRAPAVEELFAQMARQCSVFVVCDAIRLSGDLSAEVGPLVSATAMLHQLRERLGVTDSASRDAKNFGRALRASMQSVGHGVEDSDGDVESAIVAGVCIDVLASAALRHAPEKDHEMLDLLFARIGTLPMEAACLGGNGLIAMLSWMGKADNASSANLRCLAELQECALTQQQLCAVFAHGVTVLGHVCREEFERVQQVRVAVLTLLLKCMRDADARGVSVSQATDTVCSLSAAGNFALRLCRETHAQVGGDLVLFLCQRLKSELPPKNASMALAWAYLNLLDVFSGPHIEASAVLQELLGSVCFAERQAVAAALRLALRWLPPAQRVDSAVALLRLALHNNRLGVSDDFLPLSKPGAAAVPGAMREPSVTMSPLLSPIVCETLAVVAADKSRVDCERERKVLEACAAIAHLKPSKKVWRQLLATARDLVARIEAFVMADMEEELVELAVLAVQLVRAVQNNAEIPVPQTTFLAFQKAVQRSEEPRLALAMSGELLSLKADDGNRESEELDFDDLADSDGHESSDSGDDLESFIARK